MSECPADEAIVRELPRRAPVLSNKFSGSCATMGCDAFVEQGEGVSTVLVIETATGARDVWQTYCKPCAEARGLPVPRGGEHVLLSKRGAGAIVARRFRLISAERHEVLSSTLHSHGARSEGGQWVVPVDRSRELYAALSDMGLEVAVTEEVRLFFEADAYRSERDVLAAEKKIDARTIELAKLGLVPFSFQLVGADYLFGRPRAMLCDEMGLGKSMQTAIAFPYENRARQEKLRPVVIVCPKNAIGVWERELARWRPDYKVIVLEGKGSFYWPPEGTILILSYEILPDVEDLSQPPPGVILAADEAHYLKNKKAKRTGRFRSLAEKVRDAGGWTWLLTGTPILSKPEDLWSLAQCAGLAGEMFGTWSDYKNYYECKTVVHPCHDCGHANKHSKETGCSKKGCKCAVASVEHTEWGKPSEEVATRFKRFALRRTRAEVMAELPVKTYQDHPVKLLAEKKREIDAELPEGWEDALDAALETQAGVSFNEMSGARRLLAEAKIAAMLDLVPDFEEQDEPLVVMSCHTAPLDALRDREGWAVIDGSTPADERTEIASAFQEGKLKGIAGNVRAAGTAITLTRAAHMLFVDQAWNPGDNAQAEDRCVRIGQTRGVVIHRLVADHVLDRRVAELLDTKREMIQGSLGGGKT